MSDFRLFRAALIVVLTILLAACASSRSSQQSSTATMSASDIYQATRYGIQQDRGPSRVLDPSQIREIIPVQERRTIAGNKSPYTVNGQTYRVMRNEDGYRERGYASWYGEKFQGHNTSNGEVYDMYQLSAAHKTMPIPGYVRVTNLENDRSIIVRVNDRGPFHTGRVIDLSYAAAYMLGFDDKGTAMVEVEAIVPTSSGATVASTSTSTSITAPVVTQIAPATAAGQYLQVGAFADMQTAEQLSEKLRGLTTRPVFIRSVDTENPSQTLHRVRVGPIPDAVEITRIKDVVVAADLGRPYTVRD